MLSRGEACIRAHADTLLAAVQPSDRGFVRRPQHYDARSVAAERCSAMAARRAASATK